MSRSASSTWLAACAAGLALASGAAAQDPQDPTGIAPPPEEVPDQIVVTGSHIPRPDLEGVGPVSIVDAGEISLSGVTTIDELVRTLPSVGTQGISRNNNNGGFGVSFVELRNLKAARTLVLVNGRRLPVSSSGVLDGVDINGIPTQLIERVEVLRDGASAIYGSDAVAGVVNFVLRDDFEGLELDLLGGQSEELDGEEGAITLTGGRRFGNLHLMFNAAVLDRAEINQRNRFWARNEVTDFNSEGKLQSGSNLIPEGLALGAEGLAYFPGGGSAFSEYPIDQPGRGPRYAFEDHQYLVSPTNRRAVNLIGTYDFDPTTEAYFHTSFTENEGHQRLGAQGVGGSSTPFDIPFNALADSMDFMDAAERQSFADLVLGAGADPNSTDPVSLFRRMSEAGDRIHHQDAEVFRFVGGLRGELPGVSPLGAWTWNAFANYGRTDTSRKTDGAINMPRLNCAADPACSPLAEGAADFTGVNSLSPEARRYVSVTERDQLRFHLRNVGVTTAGPVLELPAGPAQLALGAEYREESGFYRPDANKVSGESASGLETPTRGDYSTKEVFWELEVPLVSGFAGAQDVTANLAGRLTDYNTFGSEYTYRYALSWSPISSLRFRGVTSTSFRAPGITQLFSGAARTFLVMGDPCNGVDTDSPQNLQDNCAAGNVPISDAALPDDQKFSQLDSQLPVTIGGSAELEAETSKFWGIGLVWQPEFMPDLELTVDFFDIEIDSPIVNPDPTFLLDSCYNGPAGLASGFCNLSDRNDDGQVTNVVSVLDNVGKLETNGIDFQLRYGFRVPVLGEVDVTGIGSYVFHFREKQQDGSVVEYDGTISSTQNGFPKFRASLISTFSPMNNLFLTMGMRYIGNMKDPTLAGLPPFQQKLGEVRDVWYMDAALRYEFNETWSATVGIKNLTDKRPPAMSDFGNSNPGTYDYVGRFGYARLNAKF